MENLSIELLWNLGKGNDHKIKINDEMLLNFSSAAEFGGNANNLNPEQALAAAVSSCHMMTFLALSAKMKWPVIAYRDNATAYLGKNSKGKMCVNKIELNPKITFKSNFSVSEEEMEKMQDRSHRYCFIANSLSEEVEIIIN